MSDLPKREKLLLMSTAVESNAMSCTLGHYSLVSLVLTLSPLVMSCLRLTWCPVRGSLVQKMQELLIVLTTAV